MKKISGKDYYYGKFFYYDDKSEEKGVKWVYSTNKEYILECLTEFYGEFYLNYCYKSPVTFFLYKPQHIIYSYETILGIDLDDLKYAKIEMVKLILNG